MSVRFAVNATSNTYYLETVLEWSGVALEPQVKFAEGYKQFRPKTVFVPLFVSDTSNQQTTLFVTANNLVASSSRAFTETYGEVTPTPATTTTLDEVLDRLNIQRIDFLSIDIELAEPQALAGFSIERFRPGLLLSRPIHQSVKHCSTISAGMVTRLSASIGGSIQRISGLRRRAPSPTILPRAENTSLELSSTLSPKRVCADSHHRIRQASVRIWPRGASARARVLRQKLIDPTIDVADRYRPVHVVTNTGLSVTGTTLNEDTFSPSRVESFSSKHRRRVAARNWGDSRQSKGPHGNPPRYMEESCLCERQGSGSVPVAANHRASHRWSAAAVRNRLASRTPTLSDFYCPEEK